MDRKGRFSCFWQFVSIKTQLRGFVVPCFRVFCPFHGIRWYVLHTEKFLPWISVRMQERGATIKIPCPCDLGRLMMEPLGEPLFFGKGLSFILSNGI